MNASITVGLDHGPTSLRIGVTPWLATPEGGHGPSLVAQAEFAEKVGCHSFWLPESHFVQDARPSPLLELAHVAARTERLKLGTTSLLLPIRQPILLAEEVATLDRLSQGRLILGIGRGFRKPLFRAMGIDPSQKRTLLEHHLDTMRRLWRGGPVTAPLQATAELVGDRDLPVGRKTTEDGLERSTVVPRPLQEGGPPIWMAAFGPKALEQAARLQLPYLASPLEGEDRLRSNYDFLVQRGGEIGLAPSVRRPIMRTVFVHEDSSVVKSVVEGLQVETAGWQRRAAPVLQRALEEPIENRVLVGSAEAVAERLLRLRRELGVTDVIVRAGVPGVSAEATEASLRQVVEMARDL